MAKNSEIRVFRRRPAMCIKHVMLSHTIYLIKVINYNVNQFRYAHPIARFFFFRLFTDNLFPVYLFIR